MLFDTDDKNCYNCIFSVFYPVAKQIVCPVKHKKMQLDIAKKTKCFDWR